LDVVAEVKKSRLRIPVLLITGHDEDLVPSQGIPILRKPFGARALRQGVERMIEERNG
jgi:DNA-binding NtrC family response regulator